MLITRLNSIVKGENVYLKSYSFINLNIINRYYFIIGIRKIFKEKNVKEISGNDFLQLFFLLSNDFNRKLLLDILCINNYEDNKETEFNFESIINLNYNFSKLLTIFNIYFILNNLIEKISELFINDDLQLTEIELNIFITKYYQLLEGNKSLICVSHLVLKSIVYILFNNNIIVEEFKNKKYIIYDNSLFNYLKNITYKLNYYQFIFVLTTKIKESKNYYDNVETIIKKKLELFNNLIENINNDNSDCDEN